MKVLMFGWEYPPHISGGLGTACHGLTRALGKSHVKVLFVVPKLYGDEPDGRLKLIDASSLPIDKKKRTLSGDTIASPPGLSPDMASHNQSKVQGSRPESITYIDIPAALIPYHGPGPAWPQTKHHLTNWNYSFHPSARENWITTGEDGSRTATVKEIEEDDVHHFTGNYGPNLMGEVHRYSDVAASISDTYSFDVIHAHDWMTFLAGIKAKKKTGKPLVVHVHSTEFDRSGEHINDMVYGIEKMGFTEADHIITVSNWTKNIVMSRYKIPEEKISVVHNGIIPRDQPEEFSFPDIGSHFVTFLGRVTHQKGPAFFVEAADLVLREFPDAHFIVAGAGDLLPQIIEKVAQLNMSVNFHFTGFLSGDQVDRIWSLTDVYVMPSVSEPFGIAPLEAIQGGVPVILSKQSGVSEVMPHAIKVDFWDTRAVAAAICSVLRYESLSHELRQNSQEHLKKLTWDKAARDVKAVYHELTGKK